MFAQNKVYTISKSQEILELSSNDSNFIPLGNNRYKVLISKAQLINNSNLTPWFTLKIKNTSNRNIDFIVLSDLYESTPESAYSNAPIRSSASGSDGGLNPLVWEVLKNSNFRIGRRIYLSESEGKYTFNLTFDKPGYWFNYRKNDPINFNNMSIAQILNNNEFLDTWKKINEYPAITLKMIHDLDTGEWQDISVEIYFELVD